MVLDIRHLRMEDSAEFEKPAMATDAGESAEPLEEGMEQLLERAARGTTPGRTAAPDSPERRGYRDALDDTRCCG